MGAKPKKRSKSKDWLEGYLEGITACSFLKEGENGWYVHVGTSEKTLEDARKEARSQWASARGLPPSGLAAVEASKLTTEITDTTENTEKPDNNPKEV